MKNESAQSCLQSLDQAWSIWRKHPDGANFHSLAADLAHLVETVVAEARQYGSIAVFTAPLPMTNEKVRITVHFTRWGRGVIERHDYIRDFDDVVQDFQLHTLERYLRTPGFCIRNTAFVRMGLALRAYSMERTARREMLRRRQFDSVESPGIIMDRELHHMPDDMTVGMQDQFLQVLEEIWFHPVSRTGRSILRAPVETPGLSLRYLYVVLRIHSGVLLQKIGHELGIHSSRLTALKSELTDLVPALAGSWLPLGDFLPLSFARKALESLDLVGIHTRFSLLRQVRDADIRRKIQKRKRILWEAFLWARDYMMYPPEIGQGLFQRTVVNEYREMEAVLTARCEGLRGEILRVDFS